MSYINKNKYWSQLFCFILTWYNRNSDKIVTFKCISMKNIFLRELACFAVIVSWRLQHFVHAESNRFTTRVSYQHETERFEIMFTKLHIISNSIHPVWSMQHIDFIAYCRPNLSCHLLVAKTENATGILVTNYVHIDAYQCKTWFISVG